MYVSYVHAHIHICTYMQVYIYILYMLYMLYMFYMVYVIHVIHAIHVIHVIHIMHMHVHMHIHPCIHKNSGPIFFWNLESVRAHASAHEAATAQLELQGALGEALGGGLGPCLDLLVLLVLGVRRIRALLFWGFVIGRLILPSVWWYLGSVCWQLEGLGGSRSEVECRLKRHTCYIAR